MKKMLKKSEVLREGYIKGLKEAQRIINEMLESQGAISINAIPEYVYAHIGNGNISGRQVVAELIDEFPENFKTVDTAVDFLNNITWFETWNDYQDWSGDNIDEAEVFAGGEEAMYDVVDLENGMGYYVYGYREIITVDEVVEAVQQVLKDGNDGQPLKDAVIDYMWANQKHPVDILGNNDLRSQFERIWQSQEVQSLIH